MNKLQRIEEMEKQLAALRAEVEQESKVEKCEPKCGGFWIDSDGQVEHFKNNKGGIATNFGMERQTREAAERARDKMRVFNRLLAYVDEFAPGHEFENGENNYHIKIEDGIYSMGLNVRRVTIGAVYMPEAVAIELCRKLN